VINVCGIFGVVSFVQPFLEEEVRRFDDALDLVRYRGPDNKGYFLSDDKRVFLGHRRLSIIDLLPEGNQPLFQDGLVIVYNGEIFNYLELKRELENLGVSFKSDTDTEVIHMEYQQ